MEVVGGDMVTGHIGSAVGLEDRVSRVDKTGVELVLDHAGKAAGKLVDWHTEY